MVEFAELAAIRLGYGLSPHHPPPETAEDLLSSVAAAGPEAQGGVSTQDGRLVQMATADIRKGPLPDPEKKQELKRIRQMAQDLHDGAVQTAFARAIDAPVGFGERLAAFWSDHFTVRGATPQTKVLVAAMMDEAIRPNLGGSFADLLIAADTHPAMLHYLNQIGSVGPNSAFAKGARRRNLGLNENLAREMIELHTIGVGGAYSQQDVTQLAELLTGLTYETRRDLGFLPARAEPGAEIVLGRRYGGDGPARIGDIHAVMRDLALTPGTATHLARKLAVHFVSDTPPEPLVARLAAVYREGGGQLMPVYRALIDSPELAEGFRGKVRPPQEFVIASARALGVTREQVQALPPQDFRRLYVNPLRGMGQPWGQPDGPNGWPEEAEAWITPQGLAARIGWSLRIPGRLTRPLPDPRSFLRTALGTTAGADLEWAVPRAENAAEAVSLILSSPDFNRR